METGAVAFFMVVSPLLVRLVAQPVVFDSESFPRAGRVCPPLPISASCHVRLVPRGSFSAWAHCLQKPADKRKSAFWVPNYRS